MLQVHNISKSFGIETVLKNISLVVNPGERMALIGPNGCGKTTLFRIVVGELTPDSGGVGLHPSDLRIGYLPQGFIFPPDETIGSYINRCEGDIDSLTEQLEKLAVAITRKPDCTDFQRRYDHTLTQIEIAAQGSGQGQTILAHLGLGELPEDMPTDHLSGGQKTRLALAGMLVSSPQLLLLDEPTNHLDLGMLRWLEDWLLTFRGAVLYISHDRAFIDATATRVLEIDPATQSIRSFAGNYSDYLEEKVSEREKQWEAYSDQQEEIAKLQGAARHVRGQAVYKPGGKADSDKFAMGFYSDKTRRTIKRAKHLEKRLERLMNEDRIDKPGRTWQLDVDFGEIPVSGRDVLILEDLSIGYGEHVLLRELDQVIRYGERVAMIGPNGTGKTTLVRTVTGEISPLKGIARLGSNVRLGYMAQEQEELDPDLDAFTTIRRIAAFSETDARAFLHHFLFTGDDVFLPVGKLSYGERARLALARLVASGCNFLILDEPINHLDIPSRARFEQAMTAFEGTTLAIVHDRYFIDGFATHIWEIDGDGLRTYEK